MALPEEPKLYFCERCMKTMRAENFYTSNNLEKYPNDGKLPKCKECLTAHLDNWNPDTYLWILQEIDVPYIPEEWDKLLAKFGQDKSKVKKTTILGRYLSKMKLNQYKKYRWKDTEFLQELANKRVEETMKRSGYSAAEITEVLEKSKFSVPEEELKEPDPPQEENNPNVATGNEDYFSEQDSLPDINFDDQLTDEDKIAMRIKWGKAYRPEEWVRLEQLYNEMMDSYDIQSAGHIDTLKLICKTSLKANQLIDIGDIEGFQKMSKVYDSLMKSGKFTAAQNKAESGEFVDSISELVEICEKEGFIPRYYTDSPMDRVDETLADLKFYTKTLVTEEQNLGNLIENAVKEMARQESKEEDEDIEDEIMTLDDVDQLKDEDFSDYGDFVELESASDQEVIK